MMEENHMVTGESERDTYDPEPYRQAALDSVIETIMLFGEYPQPRTLIGGRMYGHPRRCEFDLQEWITENMEPCETAAFLVAHITGYDSRDIMQATFEKMIEERLRAELAESGMVESKIEELYEDDMER